MLVVIKESDVSIEIQYMYNNVLSVGSNESKNMNQQSHMSKVINRVKAKELKRQDQLNR